MIRLKIFQIPCTLLRSTRCSEFSPNKYIETGEKLCLSQKKSRSAWLWQALMHAVPQFSLHAPWVVGNSTSICHLGVHGQWQTATRTDGDHWSNLTQIKHCPKSILCSKVIAPSIYNASLHNFTADLYSTLIIQPDENLQFDWLIPG